MTEDMDREPAGLLSGRLVVVAGGAGEVGEGVVRSLLAHGAQVVVPSRSTDKSAALRGAVDPGHIGRLVTTELDIGRADEMDRLAEIVRGFDRLDAVVSSIGSYWQGPAIGEVDATVFRDKLEERVIPHLRLIQRLGPMLTGRSGTFVHLSGLVALFGISGLSALGVSAAAQLALTQAYRAEVGHEGPRVHGLVIEQFVRTRSRQALPDGSLTADEVGEVVAELIAKWVPDGMLALRKVDGQVEVEPLPMPISPASVKRLEAALGA